MTTSLGGRAKIRTAELSAETRQAFLDSFGTFWNAYRQLKLASTEVSFPTFARACRGALVSPEVLNTIVVLWEARRRQPVSV